MGFKNIMASHISKAERAHREGGGREGSQRERRRLEEGGWGEKEIERDRRIGKEGIFENGGGIEEGYENKKEGKGVRMGNRGEG